MLTPTDSCGRRDTCALKTVLPSSRTDMYPTTMLAVEWANTSSILAALANDGSAEEGGTAGDEALLAVGVAVVAAAAAAAAAAPDPAPVLPLAVPVRCSFLV